MWGRGAALVVAGMLVYVGVALALSSAAIPRNEPLERGVIDVDFGPNRIERTMLQLHKVGFEYDCSECHWNQKRIPIPRRFIGEHSVLDFDHGANDRCYNCHHPEQSDAFVTADGRVLEYTAHVALCGSCHGVVHRDWRRGAHGRRSGFFDPRLGETERTDCIICHDPHRPHFAPIEPLPPPGVARGPARQPGGSHGTVAWLLSVPAADVKPPRAEGAKEIPTR